MRQYSISEKLADANARHIERYRGVRLPQGFGPAELTKYARSRYKYKYTQSNTDRKTL